MTLSTKKHSQGGGDGGGMAESLVGRVGGRYKGGSELTGWAWGQTATSVLDLSGIYISETLTLQMISKITLTEQVYANKA